jgi:hypothetical protein
VDRRPWLQLIPVTGRDRAPEGRDRPLTPAYDRDDVSDAQAGSGAGPAGVARAAGAVALVSAGGVQVVLDRFSLMVPAAVAARPEMILPEAAAGRGGLMINRILGRHCGR